MLYMYFQFTINEENADLELLYSSEEQLWQEHLEVSTYKLAASCLIPTLEKVFLPTLSVRWRELEGKEDGNGRSSSRFSSAK